MNRRQKSLLAGLFVTNLIINTLLALIWFAPLRTHTFMGDDLEIIRQYHAGNFGASFTKDLFLTGNDKFRPITHSSLGVVTRTCQDDFSCFVNANILLFILNASILSFAAYIISNRWWASIFIAPIIFILSRFSYYSVLQVLGWMESLAITFLLAILVFYLCFRESGRVRWLWLMVAVFACVQLTHERFIVVTGPLLLIILLHFRQLKLRQAVSLAAAILFVPVGYILFKQLALHSPFLVGTGGTSITSTFRLDQALQFFWIGLQNLVGINAGEPYLVGLNFAQAGNAGVQAATVLSGTLVILLVLSILLNYHQWNDNGSNWSMILILLAFIGSLVIAGSITIRLEQRFLFAPFIVLILLACFLLGKIRGLKLRLVMTALLLVAFINVDVFYRQYVNNIFFINGLQVAETARTEIIDRTGAQDLLNENVYIVTRGYQPIRSWYFLDNYFFQLYTGDPSFQVHYVDSVDGIPATSAAQSNRVFLVSFSDVQVKDITRDFEQWRGLVPANYRETYDFAAKINAGVTPPESQKQDTPTGKGVFAFNWNDDLGPHQTITILGDHEIRFPAVQCQKGSQLILSAGIPYSISDGANLSVEMGTNGKDQQILDTFIDPAKRDEVQWKVFRIPLTQCQNNRVEITYRVISKSGNDSADWVILKFARLVSPK